MFFKKIKNITVSQFESVNFICVAAPAHRIPQVPNPSPYQPPPSAMPRPRTVPVVTQPPTTTDPMAVTNFDPCAEHKNKCNVVTTRPSLDTGAVIYVVFGITDIDRSNLTNSVITEDKVQMSHITTLHWQGCHSRLFQSVTHSFQAFHTLTLLSYTFHN